MICTYTKVSASLFESRSALGHRSTDFAEAPFLNLRLGSKNLRAGFAWRIRNLLKLACRMQKMHPAERGKMCLPSAGAIMSSRSIGLQDGDVRPAEQLCCSVYRESHPGDSRFQMLPTDQGTAHAVLCDTVSVQFGFEKYTSRRSAVGRCRRYFAVLVPPTPCPQY